MDVDMTQGNIARHLIMFALPLMAGNVFQQLYNMVDTWVVGNYVSNEAFSAVGTVGPIMNLLIGFFMGLSAGTSTVIAQHYGAKQLDRVSDAVHTAMVMTAVLGVAFTVLGITISPAMLRIMKVPPEVMPEARTYLTIIFSGVLFQMIYNMGSGILRAVGDSKRPVYFLVTSAVLNTILDLVFVLAFDMGVAGVAYATIIAQAASAVLVMVVLFRANSCVKFSLKKLGIDWRIMGKICKVGVPSAIQMTITSFSNIFVQSYINYFGRDFMSGWTAYSKIDQLMLLPMQSLSLASTTFVGQNLGANQPKRARKGVKMALLLSCSCCVILMIPIIIFAPSLVAFFNSTPAVVVFGSQLLRWITPFYALHAINQICGGALRGAGNTLVPTIITLSSFVGFKQIYLLIMSRVCNEVIPIAMAYPSGWLLCSVAMLIYFKKVKLTSSRLVDDLQPAEEAVE